MERVEVLLQEGMEDLMEDLAQEGTSEDIQLMEYLGAATRMPFMADSMEAPVEDFPQEMEAMVTAEEAMAVMAEEVMAEEATAAEDFPAALCLVPQVALPALPEAPVARLVPRGCQPVPNDRNGMRR